MARQHVGVDGSSTAVIALCVGLGLLLCSLADALSRQTLDPSQVLFWGGVLLIVLPIVYRLSLREPSLGEGLALVATLVLSLYVVKVVRDPFLFTFPDEPIHAFNANQIVDHHHLFNANPILPVTAYFPGLGGATSALMTLTGMSSFGAGTVLIGAARLAFALALFLLFARISGSTRLAGLGVVLYAGNSNFLYFGAQYAYESLALPLLVVVLAAIAEREAAPASRLRSWAVPILLGIMAIVVTHHLTSYALVVVLVALAVVHRFRSDPKPNPWPFALFAGVAALGWLLIVASSTIGYVSPVLRGALSAILHTASGETAPRTLFHASAGSIVQETPTLARLVSFASVGLLGLGFLAGVGQVWRRGRKQPMALFFSIAAVGFFGALLLRFAPAAWETGNRAGEFLFIGLAFVAAYGAVLLLRSGPWLRLRRAALVSGIGIVVVGGAIAGWSWDTQLAPPLRIAADGRAIESEPLALARWVQRNAPGGRFAAADADARLILAPGGALAETGASLDIKGILSEPTLSTWEEPILRQHGVRYIVADRRQLATDVVRGYFFSVPASSAEPLLPLAAIHKFDRIPLGRIYDSGRIVVYDLKDHP